MSNKALYLAYASGKGNSGLKPDKSAVIEWAKAHLTGSGSTTQVHILEVTDVVERAVVPITVRPVNETQLPLQTTATELTSYDAPGYVNGTGPQPAI